MYNLIEWKSVSQLNKDLTLAPLTKMRYGFNQSDHVMLTEKETFDKLLDNTGIDYIQGNNTPIDTVSAANKYKLGIMKDQNLLSSQLYLEVLKYDDFFLGYGVEDIKVDESNVTDVTVHEETGYHERFDTFFRTLETDMVFTDSDYESFIYGWKYILK